MNKRNNRHCHIWVIRIYCLRGWSACGCDVTIKQICWRWQKMLLLERSFQPGLLNVVMPHLRLFQLSGPRVSCNFDSRWAREGRDWSLEATGTGTMIWFLMIVMATRPSSFSLPSSLSLSRKLPQRPHLDEQCLEPTTRHSQALPCRITNLRWVTSLPPWVFACFEYHSCAQRFTVVQ